MAVDVEWDVKPGRAAAENVICVRRTALYRRQIPCAPLAGHQIDAGIGLAGAVGPIQPQPHPRRRSVQIGSVRK